MENICADCKKWKDTLRETLSKSDSIFDAHSDMLLFEENCKKNCPFVKDSSKNS